MANIVKTIKSTFLSPKGTLSSKRLTGFLMISLAGLLITFGIVMTFFFNNPTTCHAIIPAINQSIIPVINESTCKDFSPNLTGLIRDLIYGGVALLSSTVFEKKFKTLENE